MNADLTGLNSVAWRDLSHAYGDADDVPDLVRGLLDAEQWEHAAHDLTASILHQGTIYTATIPTIGFLAQVAADPAAPSQEFAVWFLAGYADSINAGVTSDPTYLDEGTDMVSFDHAAREALAAAIRIVLPALSDESPAVRAGVAALFGHIDDLNEEAVHALHTQLGMETDGVPKATLIAAISRHGGLTDADRSAIGDDPAQRFSSLFADAAAGRDLTAEDVDSLATTWNLYVEGIEEAGISPSPVIDIVSSMLERSIPLLDRLAHGTGRMLIDALAGYQWLARSRRSLLGAAVRGLLAIAHQDSENLSPMIDEQRQLTLRNCLVITLSEVMEAVRSAPSLGEQPDVTVHDLTDAIIHLCTTDPRPHWIAAFSRGTPFLPDHRSIWADAVTALLAAGDERCTTALRAAYEASDGHCVCCEKESSRQPVLTAVKNSVRADRYPPGAQHDLMDLLGELLESTTDFSVIDGCLDILIEWPGSEAQRLIPQVIHAFTTAPLTFVSDSPTQGTHHDSPVPRMAARLFGQWGTTQALPALHESRACGVNRLWIDAVIAMLTNDPHRLDEVIRDHGLPRYEESEFLDLWEQHPSPFLTSACLTALGEKADVSYPGRHKQCVVARIAAPQAGLARIWPILLDVIRQQDQPMPEAVDTALDLLDACPQDTDHAQCREELVKTLEEVLANGVAKVGWDKHLDYASSIQAAHGLTVLGYPHDDDVVKLATALVKKVGTADPMYKKQLTLSISPLEPAIPKSTPATRKKFASTVEKHLSQDRRISGWTDDTIIDDDTGVRLMLAGAGK